MPTSQINGVLQHLRVVLRAGAGQTDGQLLDDYISRCDEAAFAALVRRHGPMVWGVCRRVLRNHQDAEDAFQATFLVLVRKAASISARELVANWLYGVAQQTAMKARATAAKRKERERQVTEVPEPAVNQESQWSDVQAVLDEALSRLPDKYRGVIVLCDLEGKTRQEVAVQLGCPEGTVASRLARARAMLAKRLRQRGVAVSGGALAAVLAQQAVSAGVPSVVLDSTIKAASLLAAGQAAATGAISMNVAALTEGVMKAMLFTKLKAAIAVVLTLGCLATAATILTCRSAAGQAKKPAAEKPVEPAVQQKKEQEGFTAWGKEVGGVQAGLGFRPGEYRVYHTGETVRLVVRVRNVGTKDVKFLYCNEYFYENPPTVTDGRGTPVPIEGIGNSGFAKELEGNLAPGKEVDLCEMNLKLRPARESGKKAPVWTLYGTGKFQVQYKTVGGNIGAGGLSNDPALSKLATGKLELQVKDAEKLPNEKDKNAQDAKLTVDLAKELLPPAAGISNADFKALLENPRPDVVKSKSLSFAIFAFRPPENPSAAMEEEFRFLGEELSVSAIARAMWISKSKGYASFVQSKYITECSCKSTAERAEGVVAFKSDLFAGRIPFVARATKGGWVITEFRLPQYKMRVVRGKDGVWVQEALQGK